MSVNRIVLPGGSSNGPNVPDSFRASLRQYDPTLTVAWNPRMKRFCIEQCVEHYASGPEHSHVCRRSFVLMAQDPEGCMMPLGERVMEMIRAADVSKAGYGPDDHAKFCGDRQRELDAQRAKLDEQQEEVIRYGSRHNRRQLHQAITLIQRHSLTPNR